VFGDGGPEGRGVRLHCSVPGGRTPRWNELTAFARAAGFPAAYNFPRHSARTTGIARGALLRPLAPRGGAGGTRTGVIPDRPTNAEAGGVWCGFFAGGMERHRIVVNLVPMPCSVEV